MRNSFFNQPATVVTALLTPADDQEVTLAMIRNAAEQGAQGIAIQMMQMPPEQRTEDNLRRLMDAAPQLPFMFIDYRGDKWLGGDDDARQECLFAAARAGAEVVDVMGDLYDPAANELTMKPEAVVRQKALIRQFHDLGAKVVMSSHTHQAFTAEAILAHLREQAARGADILKIVTRADTEEELLEAFRATMLLKRALAQPFIQLCGGKYSRPHRYLAPKFGLAVAFAILDETPASVQPSIPHLRTVLDTIQWPAT